MPRHSSPPPTSIKFKCVFWALPESSGLGWVGAPGPVSAVGVVGQGFQVLGSLLAGGLPSWALPCWSFFGCCLTHPKPLTNEPCVPDILPGTFVFLTPSTTRMERWRGFL